MRQDIRPRVENLEELVAILFGTGGEASFGHGSTFTFRPGGTAGGNVFTTWTSLMAAVSSLSHGHATIYVDDSIAPAHVTANTSAWNLGDCTLIGNFASPIETLFIDVGATLTFSRLEIQGSLIVESLNTAPVFTMASGFAYVLIGAGEVFSSTTAPFFKVTGGTEFLLQMDHGSGIGDGTHPVLESDVGPGVVFLQSPPNVGQAPNISSNALSGTGTIEVVFGNSTATLSYPQTVTTLTLIYPGLNFVDTKNGGGLGPAGTVTETTGTLGRKRTGQMTVSGTISGTNSGAATITVSLIRDVGGVPATIATYVLVTAGAGNWGANLSFVDTLPDSANTHTYSISATATVGTLSIPANQALIYAQES